MNNSTWLQKILYDMNACESSRQWVGSKSLKKAWATCPDEDWMEWLLGTLRDEGCLTKEQHNFCHNAYLYGIHYALLTEDEQFEFEGDYKEDCADDIREAMPYAELLKAMRMR